MRAVYGTRPWASTYYTIETPKKFPRNYSFVSVRRRFGTPGRLQ